jgi:hypothetical protein
MPARIAAARIYPDVEACCDINNQQGKNGATDDESNLFACHKFT